MDAFDWMVLEYADTNAALNALEIYYITIYGTKYPSGYNLTNGGDGICGHKLSATTRSKMSKSRRGKPKPEYFKLLMRQRMLGNTFGKGTKRSKDFCERLRQASTGRRHSDETKRKIGEASRKRKPDSEDTRRKRSIAAQGKPSPMKGKRHSAETKQRISASLLVANQDATVRRSHGNGTRGQAQSAEHRAKIAMALHNRWLKTGKTNFHTS